MASENLTRKRRHEHDASEPLWPRVHHWGPSAVVLVDVHRGRFKNPPDSASLNAKTPQGIRYKSLTACGLESWYRYGDSNPGPVAENHVS